eukprot:TRINITY_DN12_c0_g1_i9.p2 TRINITY_DN12_c0_g1~~TRINITY_DN12_c0_g1_i9.p2  ORF type:complete len:119 (-),score=39.87 TRINITY_DN12_c0_g1_i9:140-496(-)
MCIRDRYMEGHSSHIHQTGQVVHTTGPIVHTTGQMMSGQMMQTGQLMQTGQMVQTTGVKTMTQQLPVTTYQTQQYVQQQPIITGSYRTQTVNVVPGGVNIIPQGATLTNSINLAKQIN